jgi:hypothetical protein
VPPLFCPLVGYHNLLAAGKIPLQFVTLMGSVSRVRCTGHGRMSNLVITKRCLILPAEAHLILRSTKGLGVLIRAAQPIGRNTLCVRRREVG